ncbi:hypothetical protein [Acetobacter indonesiensis]|uniref:SMODS and SLOG-associating 2TM effector domain-containing protein n=1 Tax=Acetobacter indonesiensis TaxID=104101 RepID=A0A252ANI7_9PROT|nr:hypothetical protein [Acetobacter indonesiensis]OUI91419.1 hypothetical protein HK17_11520 [Acetobacter indonesiensis]
MPDGEIPDWLAKEMRAGAEASIKSGFESFYKTKDRALSILGWSVTIEIACVGILTGTDHQFLWPGGVVILGNALVSALCIYILIAANMYPPSLTGADIETLCAERGASNQSELDTSISDVFDTHYAHNRRKHKTRQRALYAAWLIFAITPIMGLFFLPAVHLPQRVHSLLGHIIR